MAPQCDLVLVVGLANSSNSVRLVEVALQAGRRRRLPHRLRPRDRRRAGSTACATVGVTSGASVPEVLVRGVLDHLAERGWGDVEEITTAEETLTFSLPRELRPARACDRAARSGRLGGFCIDGTRRRCRQPEQAERQHERRWSTPSSGTR